MDFEKCFDVYWSIEFSECYLDGRYTNMCVDKNFLEWAEIVLKDPEKLVMPIPPNTNSLFLRLMYIKRFAFSTEHANQIKGGTKPSFYIESQLIKRSYR